MTEIRFYHLTKTPFEKAVPQLLSKMVEAGHRIQLVVPDEDALIALDKMLWTSSQKIFLPHGTHQDDQKDRQPVYLTPNEQDNPNGATIFVTVDGVVPKNSQHYEMVVDIFDGANAVAVTDARTRWKGYSADDSLALAYWQQDDAGAWGKK
jgi:DNA polymerase-3 subunit chi